MITTRQRPSRRRAQDAAVLADLVGALPERLRRHRRDRHGLADVAGDLRRQADRTCRTSASTRSTPAQKAAIAASRPASPDCCRCSTSAAGSSGRRCRTRSAARTPISASSCSASCSTRWRRPSRRWAPRLLFVARLRHHPVDVWRRLRHRAGLSRRHVRHAVRRRHPWPAADRVVDRRHHRPGGGRTTSASSSSRPACRATSSTTRTMYILCAMLIVGLICNYLIKPVDPKWHMSEAEVAKLQAQARAARPRRRRARSASAAAVSTPRPRCSGPSSAFRWPGASGSRWRARPRSSDLDRSPPDTCPAASVLHPSIGSHQKDRENFFMRRITLCLVAAVLVTQAPSASFAQNTGPMTSPAATPLAKPSRIKLTVEHLKEMRAKWALNRPKMKACRAEVKIEGPDRRRSLVLHGRLHGQDLMRLRLARGRHRRC